MSNQCNVCEKKIFTKADLEMILTQGCGMCCDCIKKSNEDARLEDEKIWREQTQYL